MVKGIVHPDIMEVPLTLRGFHINASVHSSVKNTIAV
ncbi:MAG: hypothetical protein ACI82A_002512 [Candidatus Azotimanducaceae bacterium]|jgi:hypothetical protein